jgi:antitoxin YefM
MDYVTDVDLRENLARYMDEVVENCAPIVVTRQGKPALVRMSLLEFEGWQKTVHLLSSPRNADVLLRSIRDADGDRMEEHELIWPPGGGPEGLRSPSRRMAGATMSIGSRTTRKSWQR